MTDPLDGEHGNRDAKLTRDFADGTYTFRMAWGQLIALQEKTGVGPPVLLERLFGRSWMIGDIAQVIRLGLIGGGMKDVDALRLVRRYVEERLPMDNLELAQRIMHAGLWGAPDEPPGEQQGEERASASTTSPTADGAQSPPTPPER